MIAERPTPGSRRLHTTPAAGSAGSAGESSPEPGGQQDIVSLPAKDRRALEPIAYAHLPAEPLVNRGSGACIEGHAILPVTRSDVITQRLSQRRDPGNLVTVIIAGIELQ